MSCDYFANRKCNACTRIGSPYARQLEWKLELVRTHLRVPKILPVVGSPDQLGYRTSVKLCLQEGGKVGLYLQGGKTVAHIPGCPVLAAPLHDVVDRLFRVAPPAPLYDHASRTYQQGKLKFLTVRVGFSASSALQRFSGDRRNAEELKTLKGGAIVGHTGVDAAAIAAWFQSAGLPDVSIYESLLTPSDGDLPVGRHVSHAGGPPVMDVTVAGQHYEVAPTAFFQANASLADALVASATAFKDDGDVLLDLYGGFGAYSLAIHRRMRRAYVVDGNAAAIDAAERAARALPPPPPMGRKFTLVASAATCEAFLAKQLPADMAARVTHVIVNPPRGGLSPKVAGDLGIHRFPALRELHYVSCNPATLARDLAVLQRPEAGLILLSAQPFDMFPQTDHVEVVAKLARTSPPC